jgi:hypothetical protein
MKTTLGSPRRGTRKLAAVAAVTALVPALVSFGCNRKEDLAPAPSATQAPPPPPPAATPVPSPTPAPAPAPQRVGVKVGDAGAKDGATVVFAIPDAAGVAVPTLPQVPNIPASSLPAIASGIIGGIVGALPSGLIPPPPVTPDK